MPNYTFFGLAIPVGGDVAATAIELAQNPNILDAAAGHIFQTATATSNDDAWFTAGMKFVSNSDYWTLVNNSSASALQIRADGLVRYWLMTSASAGATVTPTSQAPVFYVSPSGVASFTGWYTTTGSSIVLGPATPSAAVSDGYVYVPMMASTPTGTPAAQPGHVAVAATSATLWFAQPGTSVWSQINAARAMFAKTTATPNSTSNTNSILSTGQGVSGAPATSGKVLVIATFYIFNNGAGNNTDLQIYRSTSAIPALNNAPAGGDVAVGQQYVVTENVLNYKDTVTVAVGDSGLTLGTTYYYYLTWKIEAGTTTLAALDMTVMEAP